MATITIEKKVNVNADTAWDLVGAPGDIANWHPAVASCEMNGNERTLQVADGPVVVEEILSSDESTRTYRYRIVEAPLPLANYTAEVSVRSDDGGAVIRWTGSYDPIGAPEDAEGLVTNLYQSGLDHAASMLQA